MIPWDLRLLAHRVAFCKTKDTVAVDEIFDRLCDVKR